MSSQASSAGHGEAEVRRKIVETGDVDVMISIRSNFFYTRTVPCELWHFDKGKPAERRDQVLMLDARNIYRKVTRKIYDFSPEQLQNLTAIVWLYRGQSDRFLALVQELPRPHPRRSRRHRRESRRVPQGLRLPRGGRRAVPQNPAQGVAAARPAQGARRRGQGVFPDAGCSGPPALPRTGKSRASRNSPRRRSCLAELDALATACRDLVKDVDLVCKLAARLVDAAEKDADARAHDAWDGRAIGRLQKELDARRKDAVEQLKRTVYFERQAHWLLSRFPDARLVAVPGLCRVVTRAEIEAADWSLTPAATSASPRRKWMRISISSRPCATSTSNWPT